jgi:hypothetical protein
VKVSELESADLDYWVGKAYGIADDWCVVDDRVVSKTERTPVFGSPSREWLHGGPIIEREKIDILNRGGDVKCNILKPGHPAQTFIQSGPTPLIAAMRAFVASKFGDEVE